MTRGDIAKNNFYSGLTCSQAVVMAFCDLLPVCEEQLKAMSLPFGGGFGRLRETCGCVSGAALVAGLLFPSAEKNEMYALVQEIAKRFQKKNGSYRCGELLSGAGIRADTAPVSEARTPEYYKKRPCPELAKDAADVLEEILKERGKI